MQLLESLAERLPQHKLILGDFTSLPPVNANVPADQVVTGYIPAHNAPIVSRKLPNSGAAATADYANYLAAATGSVDIFFGTHFATLCRMVKAVRGSHARPVVRLSVFTPAAVGGGGVDSGPCARVPSWAQVWDHAGFFTQYGEVTQSKTMLGYNPLLQDYANTRILTT